MTRRPKVLFTVFAAWALLSCRTTPESERRLPDGTDSGVATSPDKAVIPRPPPLALVGPAGVECPVNTVACSQEVSPVVCSVTTYDGLDLGNAGRFMAWGSNGCVARRNLLTNVCSVHMLPSKLGAFSCVPDATGGHCPPAPAACPSGSGKPALCSAGAYGEQKLTGDTMISASGANECVATALLQQSACRQNLNPLLLRGIICHFDPTSGECPPRELPCNEKPRGATCTARRLESKPLETPLVARAPTSCEAKLELARLACERRQRPSTLDDITCVFAR